jgi:glycosyltransferase involved in cell wall biosynthesis
MRPVRVLELRSVWGTGGGPDKTILSGAALKGSGQIETVVCYIRDVRDRVFSIDQRARQLGIDYVEIIERHSFDRRIWPALRALVNTRAIDIVHAHDHKTDFLAWLLSLRRAIVPLSTAHGFAGESPQERAYYAVEKRLLARFPRVIAVSNPIREELLRTGSRPERVTVVNNAIDHDLFIRNRHREQVIRKELGFESSDVLIGAVGRLESEKQYSLLIEAFAAIHRSRPSTRLVIVGEGRCRPELEKASRSFGVERVVRLLGHQFDIIKLHHAFNIFVQSSDREGTPNAVLEAMAMETPIVATDVGGTSELVTDGLHGVLVPRRDVRAWVDGILSVISDPAAAQARVRAARRKVENELSFVRRIERINQIALELATASRAARASARRN